MSPSMVVPRPSGLPMSHSASMMASGNPYAQSFPPPSALPGAMPSQSPGSSPYPAGPGGHSQSLPPRSSSLNTTQLQQLSAQIKAYRFLSRNVPPPEPLLSIVSGRRPTPAMMAAGKFNRLQMSPQQRAMMGHPHSHISAGGPSVPSPKGAAGKIPPSGVPETPGGQSANIHLYPPSPSQSQGGSPNPPTQSQQPPSHLSQSRSSTPQLVPNVPVSAAGDVPLPVKQPLSTSQPSQETPTVPTSKESTLPTSSAPLPTTKVEVALNEQSHTQPQKTLVKQVKISPTGAPLGIDPMVIVKEREARCVVRSTQRDLGGPLVLVNPPGPS